jgi:hypothetical protein
MNKKDINSLLNTVNSIVNPLTENELEIVSNTIIESIVDFKTTFDLELTEEQIDTLSDIALDHITTGRNSKYVDLNEGVDALMDNNEPEEVFLAILESKLPIKEETRSARIGAFLSGGQSGKKTKKKKDEDDESGVAKPAAPISTQTERVSKVLDSEHDTQNIYGRYSGFTDSEQQQHKMAGLQDLVFQGYLGEQTPPPPPQNSGVQSPNKKSNDEEEEDNNDVPTQNVDQFGQRTDTQSAYNRYSGMTDQAHAEHLAALQAGLVHQTLPPGMMEEEFHTNSTKKHKKKLFKISFMDKGVKKKGTAVSHKGVMRIVHDKTHFKVYDENNRDVTSMFKHHSKDKKH